MQPRGQAKDQALRTAIYARTSTPMQKSCDAQISACRKYIEDRSWQRRFQLKDEGEQGADPERPGYRRILDLVRQERLDAIVVWKLDRAFRSLKEASNAEELLRKHSVALLSVTEPIDTSTPIGRLVFGFLANVAQFETALIQERALLGYERRVQAGKWTGAVAPYGYGKDAEGRLRVLQDEADVIRSMHTRYARLGGDNQVAHWLNNQGIDCRGRRWTAPKVRNALTNRLTIGELSQRGLKADHRNLAILNHARFGRTAEHRQRLRFAGRHATSHARRDSINRIMEAYLAAVRAED